MRSVINSSTDVEPGALAEDVRLTVGGIQILRAWEAISFLGRLRGLHGVPELQSGDALIIRPCDAIHTMTMKQTIDVAFVNASGLIRLARSVSRFRFVRCSDACAVIEMRKGTLAQLGLTEGQRIDRDKGEWT